MVQYEVEDIGDSHSNALLISGKDSILKRIQMELLRECDKQHGMIDLIVRPGISSVMDMLLSAGKKNKSLHVKHLIPITTAFLSTEEHGNSFGDPQVDFRKLSTDLSSGLGLVPGKGMFFLYINEPGILLTFRNFFTSLSEEDLYSEEESREILRRIAAEKL